MNVQCPVSAVTWRMCFISATLRMTSSFLASNWSPVSGFLAAGGGLVTFFRMPPPGWNVALLVLLLLLLPPLLL